MMLSGHTSGVVVVGITLATTVVAGFAVILRIIARIAIFRNAGLDDACISISMLLSTALMITTIEQVNYGMGRHFETLTEHDMTHLLQWFWASIWIYYSSLCFTKLSILLQYLRVFPQNSFRKACFVLIGVVVLYSLATVITSILACVPVDADWNPMIGRTCVNLKALWFTNAGINIITDFATGILPLPVLNSLELPPRRRYALMAVFALGGLACIISILRFQAIYIVLISPDITWNNPLLAVWSSIECNVGIICSCLPTMNGCVNRFVPRLPPLASFEHCKSCQQQRSDSEETPESQSSRAHGKALELLGSYEFEFRNHVHPAERDPSLRAVEILEQRQDSFELEDSEKFEFETHVAMCDSKARLKKAKVYLPTGRPKDRIWVKHHSWPLETFAKEEMESRADDMRMPYSKFRSWYPAK